MKQLDTPFGTLFIDDWGERANRPDRNRIAIYDSRKDWLDYFSLDYFYDSYDANDSDYASEEDYAQAQYNNLCEMLEMGAEQKTIRQFVDWLGILFCYAGPNKEKAAKALSDGHPEDLVPDELETNEYVNHIGNNYIVVCEY